MTVWCRPPVGCVNKLLTSTYLVLGWEWVKISKVSYWHLCLLEQKLDDEAMSPSRDQIIYQNDAIIWGASRWGNLF